MPETVMRKSPYTTRRYQPSDFNEFALLNIEAERLEPTGRRVSSLVIAERLGRPNYSPEQNLFIVEVAGTIVGYMDVAPELAIGRVVLDCWVHPQHRRKGLATGLLGCAADRAKELRVGAVHLSIAQDNTVAKTVLSRLDFQCVRRFLELRLDMTKVHGQDIDIAASGCRHLQPGEENKLTRIQNRSFAATWGYNPNTIEEIAYHTNLSNSSPEDVIVICDGERFAGYCWTDITSEVEVTSGERKGRIAMLGVDPDYRGRGIGRRALLAGLAYFKSKGLRIAALTVDSENEVACSLYRSIGFEVGTNSLWYEKLLD